MSLVPTRHELRHYAAIARLLVKYGRSDLVKHAGLDSALDGAPHAAAGGDATPEQLADDLEALGPTFVKLGQLLSTRADIVPPAYLDALARLQDDIAPFPYAEVEDIVEAELGGRMSKLFGSFEQEPIASASLGQVHRATLRDGRPVAVKVQRPGVREQVAEDLHAMAGVAELLDAHTDFGKRFGLASIVANFREMLVRELDYRQEARNLSALGANLADLPLIVVPRPVHDYTTARVLTMDWVEGKKITEVSKLHALDVDGAALAEQLFRAYLEQVLVDGFYHADPHPGNVFLTDDGRIALIDLGMVARVSPHARDQLLRLIVSISTGAGEETADVAIQMGQALPWFDREAARREVASLVAWNEGLSVQELQVGRVVLDVTRIASRNGLRLPPDLAILGKALLNLDRVGRAIDPGFDPNAAVRRNAVMLARKRVRDGASLENFVGSIVEARDFVRAFPGRANKILDALANNELKVTVEAIDEDRLISGLQKIANRITVGLILASLVVGAALMMRVETKWTILGYPGLAMLFFLAAALGSAWMALQILRSDGRHAKGSGHRPPGG